MYIINLFFLGKLFVISQRKDKLERKDKLCKKFNFKKKRTFRTFFQKKNKLLACLHLYFRINILEYSKALILLLTCFSSVVSSFIFLGKTITNAPALLLMDWKTDGVISSIFATTQCLEVLQPARDLASKEMGALRQPNKH